MKNNSLFNNNTRDIIKNYFNLFEINSYKKQESINSDLIYMKSRCLNNTKKKFKK